MVHGLVGRGLHWETKRYGPFFPCPLTFILRQIAYQYSVQLQLYNGIDSNNRIDSKIRIFLTTFTLKQMEYFLGVGRMVSGFLCVLFYTENRSGKVETIYIYSMMSQRIYLEQRKEKSN